MKLVLAVILTFIMQIEVVGQIETYTLSLTPFSTKKYDEFSRCILKMDSSFVPIAEMPVFLVILQMRTKGL